MQPPSPNPKASGRDSAPSGPVRTVIPHVDDLGATHGANRAFLELAALGHVTCGSVMVPGPWFREIAEAAVHDTALDLGVHLTLTSEWAHYRWAPLSTRSRASGLLDDDGYFPRDVRTLAARLVPEAAEAELRAQVETAVEAGLRPTHIDAHMGAAMLPELLDVHVRLAEEYGLWPVLPRSITWAPDVPAFLRTVSALDVAGRPVADHCRGTLARPEDELADAWRATLRDLPPGLTHLALHCTTPGEFTAVAADHAAWRFAEYHLFRSGAVDTMRAADNIAVTGTRAMQERWLATKGKRHG